MQRQPPTVPASRTAARTITFAAAPGVGAPVRATNPGLRLVRISEPPAFLGATKRHGRYEFAMEAILRDGAGSSPRRRGG